MKIKYFYSDAGLTRRKILGDREEDNKRYLKYLVSPISLLVANSISQTETALEDIRKIEAGEMSEITIEGEGADLVLNPTGGWIDFTMDYDWDENNPEGHFKLREWKAAFEGWRKFLSMPESLDTVVEVDLGD